MRAPHTFTGNPLDRAAVARRDPAWVAARLSDPSSRFLPFLHLDPLLEERPGAPARLAWLSSGDADKVAGGAPSGSALLLGLDAAGAARFAFPAEAAAVAGAGARGGASQGPAGRRYVPARAAATLLTGPETGIVAQARSLLSWHADHPFCSRCGGSTEVVDGGYFRRCGRASCGASHFPRTDPVVIMLVHRGDRALLGRSVRTPPFPPGLFSCLAGYVEPGESVEEAVRREVGEEAGVRIGAVRYVSSQPWPFPSSLMLGCVAEALTDEIRIDPGELEEVAWFPRAAVREGLERWARDAGFRLPPPLTAAHRLVAAWLDGETAEG